MSLLKINILRHIVKNYVIVKNKYITSLFVTSLPPPGDGEETPGEGLKTVHVHDTATSGVGCYNDVISGREKRLKPTRI